MKLGIEGETALVLGGTQGLGLSCAEALASAGVRVLVNGRSSAAWQAAHERVLNGVFIQGDIGKAADREMICKSAEALGSVSIVVTNAGGPPAGQFEELTSQQWRDAFETNVLGVLEIVRHFLPGMKTRRFGRIINITSFVVKELYPNMSLSNSMRIGLTGAMGSLARECAAYGVTVNGLLPGLMDTGALGRVIRDRARRNAVTEESVKQAMADSVPVKRLGTADDFGPVCAFLASRLAAYITGQNICVDGGLTKNVV
ncbi:MAG: SDR family oxidoreductase [Pseudomonadota bacterium]|nr:SDR family oxidoreductase [Pseudomonadota bacterium]